MPRKKSLSQADFLALSAVRASVLHGRLVTVAYAPLPGLSGSKAGVVVSKKVAAHAVDRNLLARRIREILRPCMADSATPVAIVVRAKKDAQGADFAALQADLEPLLSRALSLGQS